MTYTSYTVSREGATFSRDGKEIFLSSDEAGEFKQLGRMTLADRKFVPLADAINKVRTVPARSKFIQIAGSLGIFLGRKL